MSALDLTILVRYKTGSDHRDEIYSYEKYICVFCKLVNNAESSSELKEILCEVRMKQGGTRMSHPPFWSTSLNKLYTLLL